ncbi:hypothetical protein [Hoeflea sp.]|jgi:hypothetical protein
MFVLSAEFDFRLKDGVPYAQALGIVQTGEVGIAAVSSDQDWVNHCQSIPGRHTALLPVWETVLWVCIIE